MRLIRGLGAAISVVVIFYLLPTLVEAKLATFIGAAAYIFLGDLFGCVCIAVYHRNLGVGLYFALACLKVALLEAHVSAVGLLWTSDALPTALMAAAFVLASTSEDDGLYQL